jgi:hypothetical protein
MGETETKTYAYFQNIIFIVICTVSPSISFGNINYFDLYCFCLKMDIELHGLALFSLTHANF